MAGISRGAKRARSVQTFVQTAFCFPTNQKKVQILDFLQTTRQVIVSGVHFSVDYTAARKITPDRRFRSGVSPVTAELDFIEPNQRTHLCFSYCFLHEEAGTAVNKIKLQLDVNLKSAESITLLEVLSFLWIDERHAKRTIRKLLAATRD